MCTRPSLSPRRNQLASRTSTQFQIPFPLFITLALVVAGILAGCQSRAVRPSITEIPLNPDKLAAMDSAVAEHVALGHLPGGVLWLEHRSQIYQRAYGQRALIPEPEPMTEDTVFDAASLTKVLATTPAILKLIERGKLSLDTPVSAHLPEFAQREKNSVTVRHLLTHTSGLRPGLSQASNWYGSTHATELACQQSLAHSPGTTLVYSDINFIVLGELVQRIDGRALDQFVVEEIYRPLGMKDTRFHRIQSSPKGPFQSAHSQKYAPTEQLTNGIVLRGVVHDPTARRMGGVAGHAGLFTTASDVARFARMLLHEGRGGTSGQGPTVFHPDTIALMTRAQTPPGLPLRALGWDIDSPYAGPRGAHFPIGSYGHTGWTGTSLWIDPASDTFILFLSNRNHPTESGDVRALRRALGTLAAEAILPPARPIVPVTPPLADKRPRPELQTRTGWNPDPLALEHVFSGGAADLPETPAPVLNGIDVLIRDDFQILKQMQGRRLGLITNHTGQDRKRRSTIDVLHQAKGVELVALFSPEHGIRGELDEKVGDGRDARTQLPIYSLYGERRAPSEEQLKDIDILLFDIQDIGCRFYTYISTLGNCMEMASKTGTQFIVLDRVNPIGGTVVEGPVLTGPRSFVAWHEIPVRHGMSVGELARLFQAERNWDLNLEIVRVEGWKRSTWFDATALPWTNPSPNMRSLTQATLYPGVGLLEFCALSVGRGTDTPFEVLGAPYIQDIELANTMNRAGLSGVRFLPIQFTPTSSKFVGERCGGIQILLTDRNTFRAVDLGVTLASVLHRLYGEALNLNAMDRLLGDTTTLRAIEAGQPLEMIKAGWDPGLKSFLERRTPHLLY